MKLSILIPCYNEKHTILELLNRVQDVTIPYEKEVIVIDDGSTDGTRILLQNACDEQKIDILVFHEKNLGKGGAINSGLNKATGDLLLIQDADLEYDPQDYKTILEAFHRHNVDVVYGSRFLKAENRKEFFFLQRIANKTLTTLSNWFTPFTLTDMETCYKAFKRSIYTQLTIEENRFGLEPEITAKIGKMGASITEVGIHYNGRSYNEGKKITWKDGLEAIYCIFKYNLT